VLTADMNDFVPDGAFDRVVSVEMFEHMRNWPALLGRVRTWLRDADSRVFLHVFAHRRYAYPFVDAGGGDWMARHFFTGGLMPSVDLLERLDLPFAVLARQLYDGTHYQRTALAWLANLDAHHDQALVALGGDRRQLQRWRLFLMGCAGMFGYARGHEWLVVHSLLGPT
jgi:cyclopropane-fatty-acyl-phospholipid synthase